MADIKVELKNSFNSKIYPKTTLDNIVKSVASSTTLITSGGVIKKDFLDLTGLISASYVSSANVIPTSAISGLSTAITNGASSYVNSSAVIKSNVTSNYIDIKNANEVTTKIPNAYAVKEFLSDYDETIKDYIDSTCQPSSTLSAGFGINIVEGSTISLARTRPIMTIPSTSTSVTLQPGEAYIIDATTTSKTLNVGSVPSGHFGLESHMEIFVANTGYIVTGTNVVLTQPLEPDSVNNCTIRFHDGFAIISVEDHVAGYIVVSSGSASNTSGTLAYGLTSASSNYIAFDGRLNGSTIPFGGVTANGKKSVVGNGYDNTILTGSVNCGTSKFTVTNLSIQNITVNGGTLTLGDAYIPSGSTVSIVSGGGLAIEKVTGEGSESVIDLGGNTVTGNGTFSGVSIGGGTFTNGTLNAVGDTIIDLEMTSVTSMTFTNSNTVALISGTSAIITLSSGAVLDLTGNTNATPIAPGGDITFESGGATVLYSSGAVSGSYMMDNVMLRAGAKLTNTAVVDLAGTSRAITSSGAQISGATLTGGSFGSLVTGVINSTATVVNCVFTGNDGRYGNCAEAGNGAYILLSNCIVSGNTGAYALYIVRGTMSLAGCTISNRLGMQSGGSAVLVGSNRLTNSVGRGLGNGGSGCIVIKDGAIVNLEGNANNYPLQAGSAGIITVGAAVDIIGSDGPTGSCGHFSGGVGVEIVGTSITNTGCIYGATVTFPPSPDSAGQTRGPWDLLTTNGAIYVEASQTAHSDVIAGGLYSIIEQ